MISRWNLLLKLAAVVAAWACFDWLEVGLFADEPAAVEVEVSQSKADGEAAKPGDVAKPDAAAKPDPAAMPDETAKPDESKPAEPNQAKTRRRKRAQAAQANDANATDLFAPFQELLGLTPANRNLMPGNPAEDVKDEADDAKPNAEEENQPVVMQTVQMYQSKVKSELKFVRLMCSDLAPEHRSVIRDAAEGGLKQFAWRQWKRQQKAQRRAGMGLAMNNDDPSQAIRNAIVDSLKQVLTEEQLTNFVQEYGQRTETLKRAVILSIVSMLDGRLFLNETQREKIEASLKAQWKDSWEKWSVYVLYGGDYFPQIPEDCVEPHLNPDQKKIWGGLMKVEFGWWDNNNFAGPQDDEAWWGARPDNGGPGAAALGIGGAGF